MNTLKSHASESNAQLFSRRVWLFIFISFMLATLAFSFDVLAFGKNSAGNLEHRIAVLSEQLQLTDAQMAQIRPILEDQMQKRKEIFEAYSLQGNDDRRALRGQMRALREDTHTQITDLLTEEQITKYEAWREERYQKMRNRGGMSRKKAGSKIY